MLLEKREMFLLVLYRLMREIESESKSSQLETNNETIVLSKCPASVRTTLALS